MHDILQENSSFLLVLLFHQGKMCIPHPPCMPQSDVPPHGMGKCRRRVLRQARALNQATDTLLKFILNCAATSSFLRVLPYAMHACRLQLWRAISFVLSRTHNHECRNIGSKCVCSLCCISSQAVKGTLPSLDSSNDPQTRYIAEHMRHKSPFFIFWPMRFFCNGMKKGQNMFVPTNPNLTDILGRRMLIVRI